MSDPFPPLGWLPQPETWPYWMPQAFMGLLPPLTTSPPHTPKPPEDPWSELGTSQSLERLGVAPAIAPRPSEPWDRSTPSWLHSAMAPSGGILGSLPQVNNLGIEKPPAWSLTPAASSRGLLAQLTQPSDPAEQRAPAWPPSAPPFDASLGSAWASAAPITHLATSHIWPLAAPSGSPGAAPFPGNTFYLSQVPPAPDWESVPADATTGITQSVGETPGLPSWGGAVPSSSPGNSPPDEAALAYEARRVAGLRLGRRERPSVLARSIASSPETEAAADDPGLRERARLNFLNSYYRGTLLGAGRLAGLAHLAATPDEEGISPDVKRVRDDLRDEYRQITADLARYDHLRSFGSAGEFGAAALGQLGGAVLSPESWLGVGAKGASWLGRAGKAALQQGAITGAADPIIQGLNVKAGVQDRYDPARTGLAIGAGALLGGSVHAAAEAVGHIGARPAASGEAATSAISGPRGAPSERVNLAAGGQQDATIRGAETGWRGLSPLDEIQLMRYNHAHRTLQELDPSNPLLLSFDTSVRLPQSRDIHDLNLEIVRLHSELPKETRQLEVHHPFPRQFKKQFRHWGIEPEDYTMLVPVGWHRLKPDGLHTGPDHWNKQWDRYIGRDLEPSKDRAIEHLRAMMKQIPWLKP